MKTNITGDHTLPM